MRWSVPLGLLACLAHPFAASLLAATVTFSAPSLDRWSYPFAGNGAEQEARVFSALGSEGFDERDSEFVVAFDTANAGSSPIPSGLGAGSYQIHAVRLAATVSSLVGAPTYDGTHDTFESYLPTDAALYVADGDAGRPIELFGAGFVGGYSRFGFGVASDGAPPAFEENNAFGFGPPTGRYVHPLTFDGGGLPLLATNNVDYFNGGAGGFDATPFAVGTSGLSAGSPLTVGTTFTFDVDLGNPAFVDYVQTGLDQGQLGFVVSTLLTSNSFPRLYTKEFPGGSPMTLELDVTLVPEPGAMPLLAITLASLSAVMYCQLRRRAA